MAQKSGAMVALFSSLTDSQKAAAQLSQSFDDVLLGPGQDGKFFRIQGPRVWIEIVSQPGIVFHTQVHYHSIWRDASTDYRA
jgi:hypothetical protein